VETPDRAADVSTPTPLDRRSLDGGAGEGDMLGGLSAGVGTRLGVPDENGLDDTPDPEMAPPSGVQCDRVTGLAATDSA
jgi:hypothetical protein